MTATELQTLLDRAKACGVQSRLNGYNDGDYKGWILLGGVDEPDCAPFSDATAASILMGDVLAWFKSTKYILELSQQHDGTWDGYASLRKVKRGQHPLHGAVPDGRIDPEPTALHALVALAEKVKGASDGKS